MEDDPLCGFDFSDEEESSAQKDRQAKLNQSEEAFQTEKKLWRPVCQTKQAARRLQFSTDYTDSPLSKEEALEIKAAAEERYYSRDFEKSLALTGRALLAGDEMQPTEKKDLLFLQQRCKARLEN
ncbi:hypothetical protein Q9L58_002419 [Maublancomyces gigas]|uniref:Uncharacterized protein n=1 Tax=Discina gigas TaxID=1032678 RepID=A0ABR3GRK4_9PEZI